MTFQWLIWPYHRTKTWVFGLPASNTNWYVPQFWNGGITCWYNNVLAYYAHKFIPPPCTRLGRQSGLKLGVFRQQSKQLVVIGRRWPLTAASNMRLQLYHCASRLGARRPLPPTRMPSHSRQTISIFYNNPTIHYLHPTDLSQQSSTTLTATVLHAGYHWQLERWDFSISMPQYLYFNYCHSTYKIEGNISDLPLV